MLCKSGSSRVDLFCFAWMNAAHHVFKKYKISDHQEMTECSGTWGKQVLFKGIMNKKYLMQVKLNFLQHLFKVMDVFVHCIERNNQIITVILIRRWEGQKTAASSWLLLGEEKAQCD